MTKPRKKCWSQSVGVYGSKARVAELTAGGNLYLLWVDGERKQRKRALNHRDKRRGKEEALALANALANDRGTVDAGRLTLRKLIDNYLEHGLHGRTERHVREARRKLNLWSTFLGPDKAVDSLSPADVDRFVSARSKGLLRPDGYKADAAPGPTTLWHDYVALSTALNFATRHRNGRGKPLLLANPLRGVRVAKTVSPAQPVAGESLYLALRAVAPAINAQFELALDLAFATGHRIGAILKLRWDDITLASSADAPLGTIRWRGEYDKVDNDHIVPMGEVAHDALLCVARVRPGISAAWMFPSHTDDSTPVDRYLANRWLRRAEKLADVAHSNGRGWHAFRRGWASARKHLPDVDVAAAGGWKDTVTMKRCYQHADAVGILRVVSESNRRVVA